jgi:hypothetical protein
MKLIPKRLRVGDADYNVVVMSGLGDDGTAGYCEDKVKLIALDENQPETEMFATLLHEALHAIEKEYGFKMKHKKVHALEAALAQVLLDNFNITARR